MAKPSLLPKHRRRITTFPLYRPLLRRHQLIVESSGLLVAVVVPSVPLLPLAVVVPPVEVVVPPVALLPLAVVVPRRRAALPLRPSCAAHRCCRAARPSCRVALSCRPLPSPCPVIVPPVALLPLAIIMPTVEVVVPPVALLPLAVVVPRLCPTHCRRVLPIAVVVRPSKSLYNIVYNTAVFTYSVAHWLVADLLR